MTDSTRSIGLEAPNHSPSTEAGSHYIFAIGIDKYDHIRPDLNNAVRDVNTLVDLFTAKYQFEPSKVIKLINQDATRSKIHARFGELAQRVGKRDTLLIYFSGHGAYDQTRDDGYWIPVDGKPNDTSTYYSNNEILADVKNISSLHTLIIADSCYSGKLFSRNKNASFAGRLENIPSRWAITSGRDELVSDGPPGTHSPMAHGMLLFLQETPDESIRLSKLFAHVEEAVGSNYQQMPRCEPLQNVNHMGGEFVFRKKGTVATPPPPKPPKPSQPGFKPPKALWIGAGVLVVLVLSIFSGSWFPNTPSVSGLSDSTIVDTNDEVIDTAQDTTKPPPTETNSGPDVENPIVPPPKKPRTETTTDTPIVIEPEVTLYPVTFTTGGAEGISISFYDDEGKEYKQTTMEGQPALIFKVPASLRNRENVAVYFAKAGRPLVTKTLDFSTGSPIPVPQL